MPQAVLHEVTQEILEFTIGKAKNNKSLNNIN